MSEPLLIFVSHSSKDNALTEQVCQALRGDGVGQSGCEPVVDYQKLQNYDVLVDVDALQAGKPWPRQLHEWMARCHAAVLLLTTSAAKSPWVLKEATILAWRRSLDTNFRFFTARFDDVKDADLTAGGFDPLMLGEIQRLASGDAAAIASEIRTALREGGAAQTPYDSLCSALEDLAQDVKDGTLKRMAERMRLKAPAWRPGVNEKQQYVQAIAAQLLSEELGGFGSVDELVDMLMATTPTETVDKILYIVAPHWVDVQAAGRLPAIARCQPRRAIAMNGADVSAFTAEMYVRRAHPLSRGQRVLHIPGGNSGDLVAHVTHELYCHAHRDERLPGGGAPSLSPAQLADVIKQFAKDKPRYFVVLSAPHPVGADLQELMARFPKLTFILWTGEELLNPDPETVVCLKPPVDVIEEQRQMEAYEAAMDIIRGH